MHATYPNAWFDFFQMPERGLRIAACQKLPSEHDIRRRLRKKTNNRETQSCKTTRFAIQCLTLCQRIHENKVMKQLAPSCNGQKNILYDLHKRWWWESWLEPANLRWQLLAAAPPASEDLILKAETQSESNSRLPRDFSYLWSIQYEMSVLWVSVSWSLGYIGKHDFTSSCLGWKFQVVSLLWKKNLESPWNSKIWKLHPASGS